MVGEGLGEWIKELLSQWIDYLKPWVLIQQFEEGVLLRFGKFHSILKPGIHAKFPIADYHYSAIVTADTMKIDAVSITTLDNKTISVGAIVEFEISDIYKYLILTNDPRTNMHDICRGVISDLLEDTSWESIKKKTTLNAVTRRISKRCEEMGVNIRSVSFTDKSMAMVVKLFSDTVSTNNNAIVL